MNKWLTAQNKHEIEENWENKKEKGLPKRKRQESNSYLQNWNKSCSRKIFSGSPSESVVASVSLCDDENDDDDAEDDKDDGGGGGDNDH